MIPILGATLPVFIGITIVLLGFTAWMTGQGLARGWKPMWQLLPYGLLLGGADRFLTWGLFNEEKTEILWLLSGYLIDTAIIIAIAFLAYRFTQTGKMVSQYPWIYERSGPFGWRQKQSPATPGPD